VERRGLNSVERRGLDLSGWGQRKVAGSFYQGSELTGCRQGIYYLAEKL